MHCRPLMERELNDAYYRLGVVDDHAEYLEMHQRYADLYAGIYQGGKLVGTCCGWPFYQPRADQPEMVLAGISIPQEHQRKGYGTKLLRYWEQQVASRGRWLVSLGSAPDADVFYVKMGYSTIEYGIKVHKDMLDPDFRNLGYPVSYVRYVEDPTIVLYIPANEGKYEPDMKQALLETFAGEDAVTIFGKYVGERRPSEHRRSCGG